MMRSPPERTDLYGGVAAGQQVTSEWEQAMSADSDDERFAALVAFIERHHPR
jgi:hypothetical protein